MRDRLRRLILWLGGHETAVLAASTALVGSAWLFLVLARDVASGRTRGFDDRLLLALRTPGDPSRPVGPDWLPEVARDITALGSTDVLWMATLAVAGFLGLDRRYRAMGFVLLAVCSGWALSFGLKAAFERPRPELVPHLMRAYFSSFPSGHSMMAAVVYGTLGALMAGLVPHRRLKFYFLSLAALISTMVGVSRVYLGVHYPTDVVAGWSAGLGWSTLCWLVGRRLIAHGQIEPQV